MWRQILYFTMWRRRNIICEQQIYENREQLKNNFISNYIGAGKLNEQLSQVFNLLCGCQSVQLDYSYINLSSFDYVCLCPYDRVESKILLFVYLLQMPPCTISQLLTPQHGPCVYTGIEGKSEFGEKKMFGSYGWEQVLSQRQNQVPYTMFHWKNYIYIYIYVQIQRLGICKISIAVGTTSRTAENQSEGDGREIWQRNRGAEH